MERATGIGGVFFRSADPEVLAAWYGKHLCVNSGLSGDMTWQMDVVTRRCNILHMRPASGDLTSSAVILRTAMRLFAERGVAAVSIRDVAAAAGVSSSLVIHHYGSKRGLKAAVDERALGALEEVLAVSSGETTVDDASASMQSSLAAQLQEVPQLMPYLRRLLVDGGPPAHVLFGRLLESTSAALSRWQHAGIVRRIMDDDVLATLVLVVDLTTILLGEQIHDVLGFDPLEGGGPQTLVGCRL